MELVKMSGDDGSKAEASVQPLPFARSYQVEALEKAIKQNTIVFLETGSGKTLIAIMLLRYYAHLLRKPSSFIAVFLVPQVVLVPQQAKAVEYHTDLRVGKYWGAMGVDFWDAATWKSELDKYEVLVMTPAILLDGLRHSFFKLDMIKVLIFDECHHARGRHPYACIMKEFYHDQLLTNDTNLPRIFGMTASPIKTKGTTSSWSCGKNISELENLMHSKIYTSINEAVLAEFVPFSTPKLIYYEDKDIPFCLFQSLASQLEILKDKHLLSVESSNLKETTKESTKKKISKLCSTFLFCLHDLGLWLTLKAAEFSTCDEMDICCWGLLDLSGEEVVKNFNMDVHKVISTFMPSGLECSVGVDLEADTESGFLTAKVVCLIRSLLEYRHLKNLRCIVFVERVISAIVLQKLLSKLLPKLSGWEAGYIAGNTPQLQSQSRKAQNALVEEFRQGTVNVIVSTSILEEGLDVQSCNLVIRFDPSATVCSFIQSRGRARMQNSDFLLMVRSGDNKTLERVRTYLNSGNIMREESIRYGSLPCASIKSSLDEEEFYRVESTGAIVTLSSSIGLLYFYCSRLPSDMYFKPAPRCSIDEVMGSCTIYLPKSCPIQTVSAHGNLKMLKQIACLEACKKLHVNGALTDNLVPQIVEEEALAQDGIISYDGEHVAYFPPELVNHSYNNSASTYYLYLITLKQNYENKIPVQDIMLAVRSELEYDVGNTNFDLLADKGTIAVSLRYVGVEVLTPEKIDMCRKFQTTLFSVLLNGTINKMQDAVDGCDLGNKQMVDYLLLPSTNLPEGQSIIDWECLSAVLFSSANAGHHKKCDFPMMMHTQSGFVCSCALKNSIVFTPHNNRLYCITSILYQLNGNSLLSLNNGGLVTYKEYYRLRHGIELQFEKKPLLEGNQVFKVQNFLNRCRKSKERELGNSTVELPPELCIIYMSPISISTVYAFSIIPSVMHRIESLLVALNLKKMYLSNWAWNFIPTIKVLEAITTKNCQETFHLESLETLGDSFLKYATSQQLFKSFQNHHEGLLSIKKDRIISNAALCKLGCDRNLPGFIRNESFDPKNWPADPLRNNVFDEELLPSTRRIYISGRRKLKSKMIADVVEALIGAFLSTGGETAALQFMDWLGIKVDFVKIPYERDFPVSPKNHVNIIHLESMLNYSFRDPSLLVEALTHGSYMLPEIPRCYQRLEFLGDSVLDYLVTMHLYHKYPGMSPGLLTDLRSASVNNDCYAQSAVKAKLQQHILYTSQELHKHIVFAVENFEKLSLASTFGWESESSFPKVLGDVIESLAGAIFVDSNYNKEVVFESIRPLLEPLITPETMKLHPVRELNELCQKEHYELKRSVLSQNGIVSVMIEVEANGVIHKHTSTSDKKTAKKLACKEVLKSLKASMSWTVSKL